MDKLLNKIVILKEPMYAYLHTEFQIKGQGGKPTLLPKGSAIIIKHCSKKYDCWRLLMYKKRFWIAENATIGRCVGTILPDTKVSRTLYLTET